MKSLRKVSIYQFNSGYGVGQEADPVTGDEGSSYAMATRHDLLEFLAEEFGCTELVIPKGWVIYYGSSGVPELRSDNSVVHPVHPSAPSRGTATSDRAKDWKKPKPKCQSYGNKKNKRKL